MKSQVTFRLPQERLPAPCHHPPAHKNRVLSGQRPQASPCEGKGKRTGTEKGRAGEGGLRESSPVAMKAAEAPHSTDSSAADRLGSFPPAFLSFTL